MLLCYIGPAVCCACSGMMWAVNRGVWGAVINFERVGKKEEGGSKKGSKAANFIVDVLVNTAAADGDASKSGAPGSSSRTRLLQPKEKGSPQVVSLPLSQIDRLSSVRIYLQKDLRGAEARQAGVKTVGEAVARLVQQYTRVPVLDPQQVGGWGLVVLGSGGTICVCLCLLSCL